MGKDTEPDTWFTELSYYHARINSVQKASKKGYELTNDDVIAHILANLPMEYSEVSTPIKHELDTPSSTSTIGSGTSAVMTINPPTPLTMDRVQQRVQQFYERHQLKKTEVKKIDHKGADIALVAFKGMCRTCGKQGHKSSECRSKGKQNDSNTTSAFGIKCFYCNKRGHKESECQKIKRDGSQTKDNEAKKTDCSTISTGGHENKSKSDMVDIAFLMLCELSNEYLANITSQGTDFFLCDSGATSHMTNDKSKLNNIQLINRPIMTGDGKRTIAK
jgi:Zinc knuckle